MHRYPAADREPVVDYVHGRLVPDPYRRLEDATAGSTRAWQAAQDDLWRGTARRLPARYRFRARLAELGTVGEIGAPRRRGDRCFFVRRTAREEHPVLYVADPERIVLDPMALDPSGRTTLDQWQPDPDGRLLAYQVSRGGSELADLYVLDVDTGAVVDGPLDRCRYSPVAWLPGGKAFYYVRSGQVCYHRVGSGDDRVVLAGASSYGLEISADGRWLTVSIPVAGGNDIWLADLSVSPEGDPRLVPVHQGVEARTALTVGRDGILYVVSTHGGTDARICTGDPARPGPGHWRELVPADPSAPLTDLAILDGAELERPLLLVARIRGTIGEVALHDLGSGAFVGTVPLPGLGSLGSLTASPDGHEVWFAYTDAVTPGTIYRYDARTGETALWSAPPGSVEVPKTEAHSLSCVSADGTEVRLLVLAKPGASGPRPAILYGYGGFGVSLVPTFSSVALAWVEAGGVFVTANLRGGGEYGEAWHRAGMLESKQNVFDDFIAAASQLISDGWTTPAQLGILGESNGGLLVGAAVTQRPDLFAAAVCSMPVLDMARYELSGLGPSWVSEYGTASEPDQLDWLLGYSPYHRVRAGVDYPAVLFTVSAGDTRVDPLHARKMCAALQHATSGDRPVLLRLDPDTGHGPAAASRGVALATDTLAFLAAHTGLTP